MTRIVLAVALVIVFANLSYAGSKSWRKPQMEECTSWTFSFSWSSSKHGKDYEDCDEDPVPAATSENEDCERDWSWKDFCGKSFKWLLYKKLRERCDDYDWDEECEEDQREECEEYDSTPQECEEDTWEEECDEYDSTPQECEEENTWEEECEEYEEEECEDISRTSQQEQCEEYKRDECEEDDSSIPTGAADSTPKYASREECEEEMAPAAADGIESSGSIEHFLLAADAASADDPEPPALATVVASTPVEESPLAVEAAVETAEVAALAAPAETVAAVVESVAVVADEPEAAAIVEIVLAEAQAEPVVAAFTAEPEAPAVAAPVVVAEIVPVTVAPVIAAVPEPSALLLALVGLGVTGGRRRS